MDTFKISNLTFSYPEQTKKAVDDLSFSVASGDFITLCGPSGCGKTTLLHHLKSVLTPHGTRSGEIEFEGEDLSQISHRDQSSRIGFVLQSPDNQIVTDKVWHELAFGLESLGFDTPTIRRRVAEMASFFGIETWFHKSVTELSGGQKQLLNLASIMAMQPSVLILDEPTSQLDPIAAAEFLSTIGKINRELGTTVIMTEHRLEEVFPLSSRVLVMDNGKILCEGAPSEVGAKLKTIDHSMFMAMPAPVRIYTYVPNDLPCPITVRDGRDWISKYAMTHTLGAVPDETQYSDGYGNDYAIVIDDIWFKYEKDLPDVVKGLSLSVRQGEFISILGGNGTGKTTTLSLIAGLVKPYRGKISVNGNPVAEGIRALGVLPQNPQTLFVKKTVYEDLLEIFNGHKLTKDEKEQKIVSISRLCRLDDLLGRHPYDLSGGEQQRAALAKVLLLEPSILLLDEPTKGLDAEFKAVFAGIINKLINNGVTVIMVSHDIEFCAQHSHRCAMFFDGTIITDASPRTFFSGNSFYTTSANRMSRHLLPDAVTSDDVITACGGSVPTFPDVDFGGDDSFTYSTPATDSPDPKSSDKPRKLPWWRKIIAIVTGVLLLGSVAVSLIEPDWPWLFANNKLALYGITLAIMLIFAIAVTRKNDTPIGDEQVSSENRKLPKRTLVAAAMILVAIPLTILFGMYYLGDRRYYFIFTLVLIEALLPFIIIFEGRKPQARELIIIAVLCAIGVAGRTLTFMLPQFKPVAALVIISGIAFGGETGFLVGAVTMVTSNIMLGQGPWTPWQMFSMGIIGFLAGLLFQKGVLRRSRISACVFGALATLIIYGGIMNPINVLIYQENPNSAMFLASYISGFPMDLVHSAATALYLWLLSRPMLEKLDRIKTKYGLIS